MIVLGIESSCDETSLAILEQKTAVSRSFNDFINSWNIKGSVVSSQIDLHAAFGGVIPELGAREHAEHIHPLFEQCATAAFGPEYLDYIQNIDVIAVTTNPGLVSALRVGVEFARSLQYWIHKKSGKKVEIVNVNHLYGHVASCFFGNDLELGDTQVFPHLHLLVSGGNSQYILMKSWQDKAIIGQTLDDAAGECLDKIGRMIGLAYPAGATLAKIASLVDDNPLDLPRGMLQSHDSNLSFSGLKTAVRYMVQNSTVEGVQFEKLLTKQEIDQLIRGQDLNPKLTFIKNMCISAQYVVVEQLIRKLKVILTQHPDMVSFGLSGGVSANALLRQKMTTLKPKVPVFLPPLSLTGDNGVMIALAGVAEYSL